MIEMLKRHEVQVPATGGAQPCRGGSVESRWEACVGSSIRSKAGRKSPKYEGELTGDPASVRGGVGQACGFGEVAQFARDRRRLQDVLWER